MHDQSALYIIYIIFKGVRSKWGAFQSLAYLVIINCCLCWIPQDSNWSECGGRGSEAIDTRWNCRTRCQLWRVTCYFISKHMLYMHTFANYTASWSKWQLEKKNHNQTCGLRSNVEFQPREPPTYVATILCLQLPYIRSGHVHVIHVGHSTMTSLSLYHNMHAWNYRQYIMGLPLINE